MSGTKLFDEVMDGGLRNWLGEQADVRAKAQRAWWQRFPIAVAGAIAAAAAVFWISQDPGYAIAAGLAIVGLGTAWAHGPINAVSADIKVKANSEIARLLGLTYAPTAQPAPDFETCRQVGLVPSSFDEQSHMDSWTGPLEGLAIDVSEVVLKEWRQTGKSRTLQTIFHGVVMGYQYARPFTSTTIVKRDAGIFNAFGAMGARFASLERVRLVDPRFEKAFEVYGTDQVEARYLVHPAFCERLIETEKDFNGNNLRMAFVDGRVIIVIELGDVFETGGVDAEGDEARVRETITQLESLLHLSRSLNERPRA